MDRLIEVAREWIGTPFKHAQACKGHGADCLQFVVAVCKEVGVVPIEFETPWYSRDWGNHKGDALLLNGMPLFCDPVKGGPQHLQKGDLITFRFGRQITHIGIYSGDGKIIHCSERGVIEESLESHKSRLHSIWRLKDDGI